MKETIVIVLSGCGYISSVSLFEVLFLSFTRHSSLVTMKGALNVSLVLVNLAGLVLASPFNMVMSFGKRDIGSHLAAIQNKCLEIVKVDSENEASLVYTHALEILKHKLVIQFMKIEANGSLAEFKADSIVNQVAASVNKSITAHAMTTAETIINGTCSDRHDGWWYGHHLYHCTEQQNSTDTGDITESGTSTIDTPSEQSFTSASLNGTFFKSVNKTLQYTLGRDISHRLNDSNVNYNETTTDKDGYIRSNETTIDVRSITMDLSVQIGDKLTQYNSTRVVLNVLIDKCQILKSNEKADANGTISDSTSETTTTTTVASLPTITATANV